MCAERRRFEGEYHARTGRTSTGRVASNEIPHWRFYTLWRKRNILAAAVLLSSQDDAATIFSVNVIYATPEDTYLWSPPCSWARGHSCLGLRTGVSPHFSTNSMRAMVAAQCEYVIGSERVRRCSGDAAERPAGPLRPPAGSWRTPRPPPYSRAMPLAVLCFAACSLGPCYATLATSTSTKLLILNSDCGMEWREARRSHRVRPQTLRHTRSAASQRAAHRALRNLAA